MSNDPTIPAAAVEAWTLADLRNANLARQEEWCPDQKPDLSFRGNELAGETGEACNQIKKLERARHGWRGSAGNKEALAEELADVIICADLCAMAAGVDLHAAVPAKFNATSSKNGLATMLEALPHLAAPAGDADADQWKAQIRRYQDRLQAICDRHGCLPGEERIDWIDRRLGELAAERDDAEALAGKWIADNEEVFEATRKQRDTYGERALKAEAERDEARRHIVAFKDNLKVAREANCTLEAERDALAERLRALEVRPQTREIEYD